MATPCGIVTDCRTDQRSGDRCRIVAALPGRWGIFLACVWLSMLLGTWVDAEVAAEDFRIETAVYVADEEQPVSKNVTLFEAGVVYDFLEQPVKWPSSASRASSGRADSFCWTRNVRCEPS